MHDYRDYYDNLEEIRQLLLAEDCNIKHMLEDTIETLQSFMLELQRNLEDEYEV